MDGTPEGVGRTGQAARPRWLVLMVVAFALYLAVRLVQGVVWVVQWLW